MNQAQNEMPGAVETPDLGGKVYSTIELGNTR